MELEIELREFYLEAIRGRVILHLASSKSFGQGRWIQSAGCSQSPILPGIYPGRF